MAFSGQSYPFNWKTLQTVNEVGAVYGLFKQTLRGLECLYVGKTDNLRRRLFEHNQNPPIAGVTHFLAEAIGTEAARTSRELVLIREFNPPGNTFGKR